MRTRCHPPRAPFPSTHYIRGQREAGAGMRGSTAWKKQSMCCAGTTGAGLGTCNKVARKKPLRSHRRAPEPVKLSNAPLFIQRAVCTEACIPHVVGLPQAGVPPCTHGHAGPSTPTNHEMNERSLSTRVPVLLLAARFLLPFLYLCGAASCALNHTLAVTAVKSYPGCHSS